MDTEQTFCLVFEVYDYDFVKVVTVFMKLKFHSLTRIDFIGMSAVPVIDSLDTVRLTSRRSGPTLPVSNQSC
jgi:hypothetical protein